jgi:crooked neck
MNPAFSEHVFVFPDDEKENNPTSFKFLQSAHAWKEAQKKKEAEMSLAAPSTTNTRVTDDDDNGTPRPDDNDRSSGDEL